MKIDISKKDVGMWVICEAIGSQHNLIDKIKFDEGHMLDICLTVGGVELDFSNVAKCINEVFNEAVTAKAQELLTNKYDSLISSINDIQERINEQKERFSYE